MLPLHVDSKVRYTDNCWEWTGCCNAKGYGKTTFKGEYWQAHRLVYTLLVGQIPDGMQLDHYKCFNRSCVNPDHLRPATNQQNGINRAGANKNSPTGIRGVTSYKGRFRARYTINGKSTFVGYFDTIEAAEQAILKLREGALSSTPCG